MMYHNFLIIIKIMFLCVFSKINLSIHTLINRSSMTSANDCSGDLCYRISNSISADETTNLVCQDTCRRTLHTATTDQEIMDALAEKCSPVLPQMPIWSCLLKSGSIKPARLPLDAGKLACCTKATRPSCQNLCWRAFQADWGNAWPQLDALCLSSRDEGELRRCLEDADASCEMGCSGLSYCARFNDRPTTLFRYES